MAVLLYILDSKFPGRYFLSSGSDGLGFRVHGLGLMAAVHSE